MRNRRRSILTVASVAVSLCLLGILLAMYHALFYPEESSPWQALRLVVHHRVSLAQALPASYADKIRQVEGVQGITVWQWFGGTYKDARDPNNFFARLGVDPHDFFDVRRDIQMPDDQRQAFMHQQTACIASKPLVDKMKWNLGERITVTGDIYPVTLEMTLVGIFTDPDRGEVLHYNNRYLQESLSPTGGQRDTAGAFLILADAPEHVPRIGRAIDGMFDNSPAPTKTESEKDFALSFLAFLGNLKLFLAAFSGAVVFTILLVSANTVAMTVREHIRETAILAHAWVHSAGNPRPDHRRGGASFTGRGIDRRGAAAALLLFFVPRHGVVSTAAAQRVDDGLRGGGCGGDRHHQRRRPGILCVAPADRGIHALFWMILLLMRCCFLGCTHCLQPAEPGRAKSHHAHDRHRSCAHGCRAGGGGGPGDGPEERICRHG